MRDAFQNRFVSTQSRQVVFASRDEIVLDTISVPEPESDELIVRIRRVGVCATDLHLLAGHIGDPFPLVPGHEFVGEVASIGAAASLRREVSTSGTTSPSRCCSPATAAPGAARAATTSASSMTWRPVSSAAGRSASTSRERVAPGLWGGYSEYLFVPAEAIVHRLPVDLPWDAAALVEPLAVASRAIGRGRRRSG